MNLDSYTRLNPYSEDEKEVKGEQRDHSVVLALAMLVAFGVIFVLAEDTRAPPRNRRRGKIEMVSGLGVWEFWD
ncbi:hypothetical protein B0H67DRAFT_644999 [Lasiosphaeris hirsuta]|uniref:Uncharacterized protein n=1 Tax=Lasiosphaeris hirsuta TaxID=260670 RepID=A0AA40DT62_9PEZI|nr:hypothetical protein B0H67DRAFT_644999 [Lasiosphaeris hirsuta]